MGAEWWGLQPALQWGAGTAGGGLTRYATIPAPIILSYSRKHNCNLKASHRERNLGLIVKLKELFNKELSRNETGGTQNNELRFSANTEV